MNRNRNINDTIVDNLNKEIKKRNLRLTEISTAMNVTPINVSKILKREINDIKVSYIYNFCEYYNIPFEDVILPNKARQKTSNQINDEIYNLCEFIQDDDSMSPTILHGDKIYTDTNYGKFKSYLYLIEDYNGPKIRRLSKDKQGNLIVKADNEKYETVIYTEEEQKEYLEIKGIVMYRITNFF